MGKLTLRDLLAMLITAAVVVPLIGYSVRGSVPFVQDPRGMAGVVIVGTVLAFAVFGATPSAPAPSSGPWSPWEC